MAASSHAMQMKPPPTAGGVPAADFSAVDKLLSSAHKRAAFRRAFAQWRSLVKPDLQRRATPVFLFFYCTVLTLNELYEAMNAEGLMGGHESRKKAREAHPAWPLYSELMTHAQVTLPLLPEIRGFSLYTQLGKLAAHLVNFEKAFRA